MELDDEQVIRRLGPSLYRLAYSYCAQREDAEDVVQEVLIKYLRHRGAFSSEQELRHWLFKVTANQCRDLLRSAWKKKTVPLEDRPELTQPAPERDLDLERAMQALGPAYRTVLYLYYYEGYSVKEIAAMLRVPVNTVKTRLSRARKLLKNEWGDEPDEE